MADLGRETEAEKRKAVENDGVSGRQKKAREYGATGDNISSTADAATEEEVEEFFAILRRIHVAIGHFKKGGGGSGDGRKLTEEGSRLRVMLERENLEGAANGVNKGEPRREEGMEENLVLDLNAEPVPDM